MHRIPDAVSPGSSPMLGRGLSFASVCLTPGCGNIDSSSPTSVLGAPAPYPIGPTYVFAIGVLMGLTQDVSASASFGITLAKWETVSGRFGGYLMRRR